MDIKRGVLRDFDEGTYTATVQVAGSLSNWLPGIAVARNIATSELTIGRRVALLQFDPSNPNDMVVCAVWEP
jgi:hypothetical protein